MNHPNDTPQGDDVYPVWMDVVAVGRLSEAETVRLRGELLGQAAEVSRFDSELALNSALDSRRNAPQAGSNFAASVFEKIQLADRAAQKRTRTSLGLSRGFAWFFMRPVLGFALVALIASAGWLVFIQRQRAGMAASVASLAITTSTPVLSPEALENFEVIRRLRVASSPGDSALIAALAEPSLQ